MSEMLLTPSESAAFDPQALDTGYAPVDEYGMPYLIHPYDSPRANMPDWCDDDHSFYQRNAVELQDQAGKALRVSRVQRVPRWLHNIKHKVFFDGTHLPTTEQEKFALTVLACGGYVSRTALDLRNKRPQFVTMNSFMHEHLQGRRQLHMERHKNGFLGYKTPDKSMKSVRKFFVDYIEKQELEIEDSLVDQFIDTKHRKQRREIGNIILEQALTVAIEPVKPIYQDALKNKLVNPALPDPLEVINRLVPPPSWAKYHDNLAAQLVA